MAKAPKTFQPLLAASQTVTEGDLAPETITCYLASFKLDGVRCFVSPYNQEQIKYGAIAPGHYGGWLAVRQSPAPTPLTRSLKPIRNPHVCGMLEQLPPGLDGELGVVDETGSVNFRATTSAVMNGKGEPDFRYFVFDFFLHDGPFIERYKHLEGMRADLPDWVEIIDQRSLRTTECIQALYDEALSAGHEGLILRDRYGPYKAGRSTVKEGTALKMKPWKDAEVLIVAVHPEFENTNEQERDERGYAKRSTSKVGKVQRARAGKLIGWSPEWPDELVRIGTGMDHATKQEFFDAPPLLQVGRFKFLDVGGYEAPRHAGFQGIRDTEDMDHSLMDAFLALPYAVVPDPENQEALDAFIDWAEEHGLHYESERHDMVAHTVAHEVEGAVPGDRIVKLGKKLFFLHRQ